MNIIEFHSRTPVKDIREIAWRNFREGRLPFPLTIMAFGRSINTAQRAYRGNELLAFWDTLWRADSNHFPLSKIANLYAITDAFGHARINPPETSTIIITSDSSSHEESGGR